MRFPGTWKKALIWAGLLGIFRELLNHSCLLDTLGWDPAVAEEKAVQGLGLAWGSGPWCITDPEEPGSPSVPLHVTQDNCAVLHSTTRRTNTLQGTRMPRQRKLGTNSWQIVVDKDAVLLKRLLREPRTAPGALCYNTFPVLLYTRNSLRVNPAGHGACVQHLLCKAAKDGASHEHPVQQQHADEHEGLGRAYGHSSAIWGTEHC